MCILNLDNLDEFDTYLTKLSPYIGKYGGRYFKADDNVTQFKLNDIVHAFQKIAENPPHQTEQKKINSVVKKIRKLDQDAHDLLENESLIKIIATFIRQFFGNLFFDKYKILNEIQFSKQKLVTSVGNYRLMTLEGEVGSVSCRVRGISANYIPIPSENGMAEFYLRSIPRVRNLVAVRGPQNGSRMIGPCDYFGNIEKPYENEYTIQIDDGVPAFIQHKKRSAAPISQTLSPPPATKIQADWLTGARDDISIINENILGESLFKQKGILKIAGGADFELHSFDATTVDLLPFKARLVKNNVPFHISNEIISPVDDYRVVSYLYESGYAAHQVNNGGGLFLETHSFPQTITPLDENSRGFVTLAKWSNETDRHELEVIGVEIPFGYTLVVEEYCIHGDTNLDGMFMMCMTSSHASMQTADTVFLKNSENLKNISLSIKKNEEKIKLEEQRMCTVLHPIVSFKE